MADGDFSDGEYEALDEDSMGEDGFLVEHEEYDKGYTILDLSSVQSQMQEIASKISAITQLSPATTRLILRKFNWNSEKLLEKFYEIGEVNVFLAETVYLDTTHALEFNSYAGECELCCDEGLLRSLKCGHTACSSCWNRYIATQIVDDGAAEITCFFPNCGIVLDDEQVVSLILNPEIVDGYNRLLGNVFVDSNSSLKWCSGPGCDKVIKLASKRAQSVYCDCGTDVCPACNECAHLPLSCERFKAWKDGKSTKDVESLKWINDNSRPCPACKVPIEKNGGCNFMTCTNASCRAHFCWQCMKVVRDHDSQHACHLYQGNAETPEIADMNRFNHYFQRFQTHRNSENIENKLRKTVADFIKKTVEREGCSPSRLAFMSRAIDELLQCRRVLAYSYCFIYYLKGEDAVTKGQQLILEDNVEDLEMATEKLSSIFEKKAPMWKAATGDMEELLIEFYEKSKYLSQRRKALLEHCAECVDDGLC